MNWMHGSAGAAHVRSVQPDPSKSEEAIMPKLVPATQTGSLTDHQHGTDDTLVVAVGGQPFYGDALSMFDNARGGDDVLIAADPLFNILDGDAGQMHDHSRGGSDHLIGADNSFNF